METNGARPKEKRDDMRSSGGYRERHNMNNTGARPNETLDAMRSSGGYRERHNMDNTGARPKETLDARSCSGGQNTDYQLPSQSVETSQFERHLSIRLCEVLDTVGASKEFRKLRQECALSTEILTTLDRQFESRQLSRKHLSLFIFGSSSEGTTTPGMNSDIDVLMCHDYIPVVDNISHAEDNTSLLLIRGKHTKPGYVKLQCLYYGQPQTVYTRDIQRDLYEESDGEGRICLKHVSLSLGRDKEFDERNGPADTSFDRNADYVNSLRCSKIPVFCTDWIVRKRSYRWPSKHMLVKMSTMGCFVVGVGHPASKEKNIEWRLSFSLQERELMFSMNLVQHKCYILLKLIKKDIIEPLIGKLISSYHLKTCMFYVIENTKSKLWKRSNLAQCVLLYLHVLFKWILEGYCPNFFIKDENMFEIEIHRTQRKNAVQHLKHVLSNGCIILFLIKLDYIGDFLKRVKSSVEIEDVLFKSRFAIKINTVKHMIIFKTTLCHKLNDRNNPLQTLQYLHTIYLCYSQTNCMKDHTEQQTQESIAFIIPYVHLQMAQSYASAAFSIDAFEDKYRLLQSWDYHLKLGRHFNMTSSRLLEVTILYKLEQYEKCILILDQLEQEIKQNPLSICTCDTSLVTEMLCSKGDITKLNNLTVASIFSRISTCVIYLRSDVAIIPQALQFEMYRSFGSPRVSMDENDDDWMDLVVVEAHVYLYFIKYLACTNRSQLIQKHLAINNLESVLKSETLLYHRETGSVLKSEIHLHHRETGYNLLGWICFLEGWIRPGIQYFRKSWSLRPHHNAAKFHIMFYIFGDRRYKV